MVKPGRQFKGSQSRDQFVRVLKSQIQSCIPCNQQVLIVGGSSEDEDALRQAGFTRMVNSNLPSDIGRIARGESVRFNGQRALDVEEMSLPDGSFDLVFAHAVLHHCRSPHRALCEMLRVSRRFVVFLEPNDSLAMSLLVRLRFSFPYELPAVIDHDYRSGGVRDSQIPNFIYRWSREEVRKTISSYMPERIISVRAYPYWDFSVTEEELSLRNQTRIGSVTSIVGARNFISSLQVIRRFLNLVPFLRKQGNKFFCCVEKSPDLKPWLEHEAGQIVFNRAFSCKR